MITDKFTLRNQALRYAEIGLFVFPLHEPIFDDEGMCTGCTCEEFRRSEECKKKYPDKYDPEYVCKMTQRGKHPRIRNWEEEATTDPEKIKRWWRSDLLFANIGLAVGKSGLIMIDMDSWKEAFQGQDLLTLEERDTVTVLSGSGGEHVYYKIGDAKFGNARWNFPKGVDIRGHGGQAVLPGSKHWTGNFYRFEEGYSFFDREPAELPERLFQMLTIANEHKSDEVSLSTKKYPKPDIDKWRLSSRIVRLLYEGQDSGDRSEVDQSVLCGLVRAGLSDEEIMSVFQNFPVGTQGKYAEAGNVYLAFSIRKARDYITSQAMPQGVTWPYSVENGALVLLSEERDKETGEKTETSVPLCTFEAHIDQVIVDEGDNHSFVVAGTGKISGEFKAEIEAWKFEQASELSKSLGAVLRLDHINPKYRNHIGPAIKKTSPTPSQVERYHRIGWSKHGYLMPGRDMPGVVIDLNTGQSSDNEKYADRFPFVWGDKCNLDKALVALRHGVEAIDAGKAMILLSFLLSAPLSAKIGWQNRRYAMFIRGLTGTMKTTLAQTMMSIYGSFTNDESLIKLGEGSTSVSVIGNAITAAHAPVLYDNFKPNTKFGPAELIGAIHNILEGGEKNRGNADGSNRATRRISCWPLFTGEDFVDTDPAALARILTITLTTRYKTVNEDMRKAQSMAHDLPAIGYQWIRWIEEGGAAPTIENANERFSDLQQYWIDQLMRTRDDVRITLRVSENLALNQLAYEVACQHPTIGRFMQMYKTEYMDALHNLSNNMANETTNMLEYQRFLSALNELIGSGNATLIDRTAMQTGIDARTHIGFKDKDGIYLMFKIAKAKVLALIGPEGLSNMSDRAIVAQMMSADLIASTRADGRNIKVIGHMGQRFDTLHLKPDVFDHVVSEPSEEVIDRAFEQIVDEVQEIEL